MRASRVFRPLSPWPVALACMLGAWSAGPAQGQGRPAEPAAAASVPKGVRPAASPAKPAGERRAAAPARRASEPAQSALDAPMFYDILVGEILDQQGDAAGAAQFLQDAAVRSKEPRLYARLFSIAMRQRDGKAALKHAKAWQAVDPTSTDAMRAVLVALMGQRSFGELDAPLRQLLVAAKETELPSLLEALPNWLTPQLDADTALKTAEPGLKALGQQASRSAPVRQQAWVTLALLQWRAQKQAQAVESLRQGDALLPGQWAVARLAAEWLPQRPELEAVAREFLKLSEHQGQAEQVRTSLASFLMEQRRIVEAQALLQAQTGLTPDSPYAWFNWGVSLRDQQRDDEAETSLRRFWTLLSTAPAEVLRGITPDMRLRAARFLAERSFERGDLAALATLAQDADPKGEDPLVQYWRARALAQQGRWQEGLALLSGVTMPANRMASQPYLKGRYLIEVGQWEAAVGVLEDGIKAQPDHLQMALSLSSAYERVGRTKDAVRLMEQALKLDPQNPSILNGLGYMLIDMVPDRARARTLITQALALQPDHPAYQDSMGWLLFREGAHEEALVYLNKSWQRLKDPEVAAHLGEVLWALGRRDEARAVWKEGRAITQAAAQSLDMLAKTQARLEGAR